MTSGRVAIDLRRPRLRLHFGVRPTIVIGGVSQPTQWGVGTWKIDEGSTVGVFLFARGLSFGRAETTVDSRGATYMAPRLPFLKGRFL